MYLDESWTSDKLHGRYGKWIFLLCSNLIKKNIVGEDICAVCHGDSETGIHLFRDCPFAKEF
jgi:hypothetical protein